MFRLESVGEVRCLHPATRHRQFPAGCESAALDRPSDAHRLDPPQEGVNDDLINIRYAFLTC